MPALRSRVYNALRQYNAGHGLSTKVQGSNGKLASIQAANHLGLGLTFTPLPSYDTISVRSIPQATGCDPLLLGRQDHKFQIKAKLGNDTLREVALRKYSNLTVHNWMDFYVVTNQDGIVEELSSAYAPLAITELCSREKLNFSLAPLHQTDNLFLWADDCDPGNYCHFMYDYMPQLSLLRDLHGNLNILMPNGSDGFHVLCQQIFLDQWYPFNLKHGESLFVSSLYSIFPSVVHPMFRCSWWAIDFLNSSIPETTYKSSGKILYISRSRRTVRNESQLLEALRMNGMSVDKLSLEGFNINEQIGIMRSYSSIIGVHGAGFTNIVFGLGKIHKVLEILPVGCGTPAFAMMGFRLGYDHAILGVDPVRTTHPNHPDCVLSESDIREACCFLEP
jgi:hypothetical protein